MKREEPNLPLGVFSVQQQLGVDFGCIQKILYNCFSGCSLKAVADVRDCWSTHQKSMRGWGWHFWFCSKDIFKDFLLF